MELEIEVARRPEMGCRSSSMYTVHTRLPGQAPGELIGAYETLAGAEQAHDHDRVGCELMIVGPNRDDGVASSFARHAKVYAMRAATGNWRRLAAGGDDAA